MKTFFYFFIIVIISAFVSGCACERIDAGSQGIRVKMYESDSLNRPVTQSVSGTVWYNVFTEEVYEYSGAKQTTESK